MRFARVGRGYKGSGFLRICKKSGGYLRPPGHPRQGFPRGGTGSGTDGGAGNGAGGGAGGGPGGGTGSSTGNGTGSGYFCRTTCCRGLLSILSGLSSCSSSMRMPATLSSVIFPSVKCISL